MLSYIECIDEYHRTAEMGLQPLFQCGNILVDYHMITPPCSPEWHLFKLKARYIKSKELLVPGQIVHGGWIWLSRDIGSLQIWEMW